MADFIAAVEYVLRNEGGFVDNANDPGGATNFGVSLRFLRDIPNEKLRKYGIFTSSDALTSENLKDLTLTQAGLIYRGEFWEHAEFEKIPSQNLCNYLFDCCIQHGMGQGIKLLQRAIWAATFTKDIVSDDGILGEKTLNVILTWQTSYPGTILAALRSERAGLMRLLAQERNKDKEFLDGWLNRAYRI